MRYKKLHKKVKQYIYKRLVKMQLVMVYFGLNFQIQLSVSFSGMGSYLVIPILCSSSIQSTTHIVNDEVYFFYHYTYSLFPKSWGEQLFSIGFSVMYQSVWDNLLLLWFHLHSYKWSATFFLLTSRSLEFDWYHFFWNFTLSWNSIPVGFK